MTKESRATSRRNAEAPLPRPAGPSAAAGVGAMAGATLLWGGTFVVIRDSLAALEPRSLVFARFAVAAALFAGILVLRRRRPTRAVLAYGAVSGVFVGGCYLLQAMGLTRISAGSSAFLTCAGSLFTGLLAWPLLRQRPGAALLGGIALALAGAALLSLDSGLRLGWGEGLTLAGALSFSLALIVVARLGPDFDPLALAAVQSLTLAVMLAPAAPRAVAQLAALSPAGWARFAYLALAGSLVAPVLQLAAQRSLPPGRVGLLLALEPVFALLIAVSFGGERFVARWWLGASLILCAVLAVEWPALRGLSAPRRATG